MAPRLGFLEGDKKLKKWGLKGGFWSPGESCGKDSKILSLLFLPLRGAVCFTVCWSHDVGLRPKTMVLTSYRVIPPKL